MPNLERSPGKITIPGRPEAVSRSRVRGAIGGRLYYEITDPGNIFDPFEKEKITEALSKDERVFKAGHDGLLFVSPASESDSNEDTVDILGRPEEVELSRVEGDFKSGIRFEVRSEQDYPEGLIRSDEVRDLLKIGGRVFITEDDDLLMVKPPINS